MKLRLSLFTVVVGLFFLFSATSATAAPFTSSSYPAYTIPVEQEGVRQPVILLNGTWQFKYSPQSKWTTIKVPGEAAMQGYAIEHDKPFSTGNRLLFLPIMPENVLFSVLTEFTAMLN